MDENSDISTTYLGKIENKGSQDTLKVEDSFPISESGYTLGRLLDGSKCQLLLDTGASKSFTSKSFYMQYKSLHTLPNLPPPHKGYKLRMVSVLVYYL